MPLFMIVGVVLIGFAAGLRGLTAPAVVAGSAYLGCTNLGQTTFSFMASPVTVAILSMSAVGEYAWDLMPNTPSRTDPPGLISRILTGSFSAACLLAATGHSIAFALLGGVAAIVGAYVGLRLRLVLVSAFKTRDAVIAIPEDLIAIAISIAAVCVTAG